MMRSVMILQCGFGEAMYVDKRDSRIARSRKAPWK
jgi:hypothetical protein